MSLGRRKAGHKNAGHKNAGHINVGHRKAGYRGGRPARLVARALVAGRAWAAVGLIAAAIALALPSTTGASPPPAPKAQRSAAAAAMATNRRAPGVTLAIASSYKVTVPPGTWVPVTLSVANRGTSDVRGEILVQAPAAQPGLSTPGCLSNGPSTFTCLSAEDYSSSLAAGGPPSLKRPSIIHYTVPLELAAGTKKQLLLYLLTGPPGAGVSARVEGATGTVLARASAPLPVAYGLAQPAILVVTDSPSSVTVLGKLVAPTGAQPQLQYSVPSALPTAAAALGAFRAVTIDQADTSGMSPGQAQALEGYVEAGGSLLVAGGLDWGATTAGLPARLLPGAPTGSVSSWSLPELAALLRTTPVPGKVDLVGLRPRDRATDILVQGKNPVALEGTYGRGHVVLSAFDPAAAPLSTWAGAQALLSRVFAPAFEPGYYDSPLPYAEAGGVFPVPPSTSPAAVVAGLGGNFDTGAALMSPTTAASVLATYLGQVPSVTRPPAAGFIGLLLLLYIAVVGLVLVAVFCWHRRRAVVWVTVPTLAITAALAAMLAGVGAGSGPLVNEVRVSQVTPSSRLAQVLSLGVVQLPGGGSRRVELSSPGSETVSPGLVGNLAAGAGAEVTVGQRPRLSGTGVPGTTVIIRGGPRSRAGWAVSETERLAGSIHADVTQHGTVLLGTVRNDLGVKLTDAEVVLASGEAAQELGSLRPGRSTQFELAVSPSSSPWPQAFGAPVPISPDPISSEGATTASGAQNTGPGAAGSTQSPPPSSTTAAGQKDAPAQAAERQVQMALGDLAASYSTEQGGAPVFVAMAASKLFPLDAGSREPPAVTDVIIVPLSGHQSQHVTLSDVPGELVGSNGVAGETEYALTTGSLMLNAGGSFDYQFLLPGTRWHGLQLDLGSASGETYGPALVAVRAYNYATSHWDPLRVGPHKGELLAPVLDAADHLGPGGALEVQVMADQNGVEVYGAYPTLSATPLEVPGPMEAPGPRGLSTAPYTVSPRLSETP